MNQARRLSLHREALTSLDSDELATLAAARPFTLSLCTTTMVDTYRCPAPGTTTILETIRSTGATECTS